MWLQREISLRPPGRGFHLITRDVVGELPELGELRVGLLHLFMLHTSASLTLNENASPDVRRDFEARLITLSNVHGVLTRQSFESADLHEVIASTLRPHDAPERRRFTIEGPALRLGPKSAVARGLPKLAKASRGAPDKV